MGLGGLQLHRKCFIGSVLDRGHSGVEYDGSMYIFAGYDGNYRRLCKQTWDMVESQYLRIVDMQDRADMGSTSVGIILRPLPKSY